MFLPSNHQCEEGKEVWGKEESKLWGVLSKMNLKKKNLFSGKGRKEGKEGWEGRSEAKIFFPSKRSWDTPSIEFSWLVCLPIGWCG